MNTVPLLLAWRYLKNIHTEQSMRSMVRICVIGIFIGTFSLALVLSIMQGFEQITHEKFRGIHAPITIRAQGQALDLAALSSVFVKEFPEITAYSPSDTKYVIIQSPHTQQAFTVVTLKGIVPDLEASLHTISDKLVRPATDDSFVRALRTNHIILGKKLAEELAVERGDSVTLLYPPEEHIQQRKLSLDQATARVGGIFDTGIDEIDTSLALCSFDFLQTLFADAQPTHVGLTLKPNTDEIKTIDKLIARTHLDVFSWKDLYPALVAALKLEKYAMFLIMTLIMLVASMNIISLLFMHITHKKADIAILKTMGMPDSAIKLIFTFMGIGMSFVGSISGLLAAYFVGSYLERHPLITLPDAYYVSHLPIVMTWSIFALVLVLTLLLSLLATWMPTTRISTITIAKIIRMES